MNEPYHFFLSISASSLINPLMRRYTFLTHHLTEISRWTQEPHITMLGFNSYIEPSVIKAFLSETLLSYRVAPLCATIDGCAGHSVEQMNCLLIDREDARVLRQLRKKLSAAILPYVAHRRTFKRYLNYLFPIFHIAVGKTMSPAHLETLASTLRGKSIKTDFLTLEVRKGKTVLQETPLYLGMEKNVGGEYRVVYSTHNASPSSA